MSVWWAPSPHSFSLSHSSLPLTGSYTLSHTFLLFFWLWPSHLLSAICFGFECLIYSKQYLWLWRWFMNTTSRRAADACRYTPPSHIHTAPTHTHTTNTPISLTRHTHTTNTPISLKHTQSQTPPSLSHTHTTNTPFPSHTPHTHTPRPPSLTHSHTHTTHSPTHSRY